MSDNPLQETAEDWIQHILSMLCISNAVPCFPLAVKKTTLPLYYEGQDD